VTQQAEKLIERPAAEVWARISDFGDVSWIPGSGDCHVEDDTRVITMPSGFRIVHRLLEHDDATRTYRYELISALDLSSVYGPDHQVTRLRARVHVEPRDDSSSLVTYETDTHDWLVEASRKDFQAALDNLDALLTS